MHNALLIIHAVTDVSSRSLGRSAVRLDLHAMWQKYVTDYQEIVRLMVI